MRCMCVLFFLAHGVYTSRTAPHRMLPANFLTPGWLFRVTIIFRVTPLPLILFEEMFGIPFSDFLGRSDIFSFHKPHNQRALLTERQINSLL